MAERISDLPALSPSVMKILDLSNDVTASPKDLMNIIKLDPMLTGKILTLVNSSYFSMPQKISSLNRALILLGFNTIKNIALSSALVETTGLQRKSPEFDALWQHLLAVGVTGKLIASKAQQPRNLLEEYFIAGLVHDIGDFLLLSLEYQTTTNILKNNQIEGFDFAKECQSKFLYNGPSIGALVISHWRLPDSLKNITQHRSWAKKENAPFIINAINIADKLVRSMGLGLVTDMKNTEVSENDLERLNLSIDDLNEVKVQIPESLEKAQVFLKECA
jgi:HD-like signal output (HDOD) protein